MGDFVNVDVVQGSALRIHQSDKDVHNIEGKYGLGSQRVETPCRRPVVDFDTVSVRLLSPVLQSLQFEPLAHLLLSKLHDPDLFWGVVCASESRFPVFNHFDVDNLLRS